jgi:starch-binding outer membrane protein, SusD/RagB family
MNKKEIRVRYIIICAIMCILFFTTWSCKKDLNEGPINATSASSFWDSEDAVNSATAALYGQLRSNFRSDSRFFTFGDMVA